jgi:DNA processing protein
MTSARTLTLGEPGYPEPLGRVTGAPRSLRVRGELGGGRRVAIVGARDCDPYGLAMADALARGFAAAGVSVVSGGAAGVDGAAHRAALAAGGHTVAVFGGGLDRVFPAEHAGLFEEIVARGGALLSEREDGDEPLPYTFPRRNRIISGLSDAVVVVRATLKSGSLVTARWARKQGVPVFAVPGNADDPRSEGTIALLREGARLAVTAGDVLSPLGILAPPAAAPEPVAEPILEAAPAAIWKALRREPKHVDSLAKEAGMGPGPTLAALLGLELEGLCEQRPGHYFVRRTSPT